MENKTLALNFYGVTVTALCPPELFVLLRRDFSYFEVTGESAAGDSDVSISIYLSAPPYERIPPVRASLYQPDSIAFDKEEVRYVDYAGKALCIYDYRAEKGEIYSPEADLLHEIAYLLIHSRAGEMMDKKGMHRVHALGVVAENRGALCLLPQGGGKTTLCLDLLKNPGIRLLSDDTPVITTRGEVLPFPLRMGLCADRAPEIPGQYLSTFFRRRYGPKILIDIGYFKGRIAAVVRPAVILLGEREYSSAARITRTGRLAAAVPLLRNCVVGLGLPQMVEYFLRFDVRDMMSKMRITASRVIACWMLLRFARVYRFTIGTDCSRNSAALAEFLLKEDLPR
ncbi:MAG: hypothetical protein ACYC5N_02235 [Endomicrobiales bacterium]